MIYTIYLVDKNNSITETISLDVINSFGEDYSSNIAQNPVENGYVISDSISISNPKFSIGGVITDSKFRVSGQLVVFNGTTFVKSKGDSRDQFQQISDDDYADKVKARLIKLWENKEVFGILESTDINNIKGSQVRNIFPCVLSNLSFNKSDSASAIYPNMSFERIRYAVVTVGTVTNPAPELISKYQEQKAAESKTNSSSASTTLAQDDADAKKVLKGINGEAPVSKEAKKDSIINLNKTAQASAQSWWNDLGAEGRRQKMLEFGSERKAKAAEGARIFKYLLKSNEYSEGAATYEAR